MLNESPLPQVPQALSAPAKTNWTPLFLILLLASLSLNGYQYYSYQEKISKIELEVGATKAAVRFLEQENKALKAEIAEALKAKNQAETITFRGQMFDTYRLDLKSSQLDIFWTDKDGTAFRNIGRLKEYVESRSQQLLFAMNAGMYMPDNSPQGLFVENGVERKPLDLGDGQGFENFYLKPNGVFFLTDTAAQIMESEAFSALGASPLLATQSGPMLLIDGKIHPRFREGSPNLNVRNGVGVISPTEIVFIISQRVVNFYDFASVFKQEFGCENALYLDGAISRMYLPELNRSDLAGNLGPILGVVE